MREPAPERRTPATITAALMERAATQGRRPAFTVHGSDGAVTLDYHELLERSLQLAAGLRARGLRQGDRLLICLPTCAEILTTIYGTLLAGAVCVPVYPPMAAHGLRRWKNQVLAIARVAQPCGALTTRWGLLHMSSVLEQVGPELFTVTPSQLALTGPDRQAPAAVLPERDLAFLQFTSGTTRQPRGVSVTHAALMANIRGLLSVMELSEQDVSVSWLPPYHDMGLVGHIFVPVLSGVHQHLLPPTALLRRPARWLQLITETGATQTTAPNFAYSICARRISRSERSTLDLGSLRWALNGAEAVQAETLGAFCRTFGPHGFRPEAFRPVYGLAEATLTATFGPDGGARIDRVDRHHLAVAGEARPVPAGAGDALAFVSVGRPIPGHELTVTTEEGGPLLPRRVGEIRFRGPSVMGGYFNNPQATQEVLRDGWLLTGDLGYVGDEGELFVTGRKKDLIIKGGRNYLPQDFEAACIEVPGLRPGRAVAFGLANPHSGTEDIVLVAEVRDPARTKDPVLIHRVARTVSERTGLQPDRIELAEPGILPRTTSGKLQRGRVKAAFEAGSPLRTPPRSAVDHLVEGVRSVVDLAFVKISRIMGWQ